MKNKFDKAFEELLAIEGYYSNDPADSGGKTKFGITEWLARQYGYEGNMKDLSLKKAKEIVYKEFWLGNKCNKIDNYNIAFEVFEQTVNIGDRKKPGRWLQESYNLLSDEEIAEDGLIGPGTLQAVNKHDKPERIAKLMNLKQGNYYIEVAENDESQEKFLFGWIDKRVKL